MNKYGAHRITIDGMVFDSKHEANRWCELKYMERAGLIKDLKRQVPFELLPSQRINGRVKERSVRYLADFVYKQNGKTIVEDAKSPATRTKEYIIKRKLMLYILGIEVIEV